MPKKWQNIYKILSKRIFVIKRLKGFPILEFLISSPVPTAVFDTRKHEHRTQQQNWRGCAQNLLPIPFFATAQFILRRRTAKRRWVLMKELLALNFFSKTSALDTYVLSWSPKRHTHTHTRNTTHIQDPAQLHSSHCHHVSTTAD